jgi:hypothetical protein
MRRGRLVPQAKRPPITRRLTLASRRIISGSSRRVRAGRTRRGSAERADNFAVSGLRESLQRLGPYETEGPSYRT